MAHCSSRRLCTFVACVAIIGGVLHPAQVAGSTGSGLRAARLNLSVAPNSVALGQPLAITLRGARAGAWFDFTMQPQHRGGFGGGLMGRHRAGVGGIIRFVYPGPTMRWEVGQWSVYAWRRGSAHTAASAILTVRAGHPGRATLILAVPLGQSSQVSYRVQLYQSLAGGVTRPLYHPFITTDGALAVASIALSNDGRWLSYSDGAMRLHLVALPRGADRVIGSGLDPQFSPDARYLAFLTHNTPGMLADGLLVYDTRSGAFSRAGQPFGVLLNSFAWSPRGDRLAWQIVLPRPGPVMVAVAAAAHPAHYRTVTISPPKPVQTSGALTWSVDGGSLLVWGLAAMGNTPAHPLPLFVLLRQPLTGGSARVLIPATPTNWIEGIPPAPVLNRDGSLIASLLGGPKHGLDQLVLFRRGQTSPRRIALSGEPRQVAYDSVVSTRLVTVWNAYRDNQNVRRAALVDTATGQTHDLGPAVAVFWLPNTSLGK